MPCKKSELVSAINSYASARAVGDANLINYSSQLVSQLVETLELTPEEEEVEAEADVDQPE